MNSKSNHLDVENYSGNNPKDMDFKEKFRTHHQRYMQRSYSSVFDSTDARDMDMYAVNGNKSFRIPRLPVESTVFLKGCTGQLNSKSSTDYLKDVQENASKISSEKNNSANENVARNEQDESHKFSQIRNDTDAMGMSTDVTVEELMKRLEALEVQKASVHSEVNKENKAIDAAKRLNIAEHESSQLLTQRSSSNRSQYSDEHLKLEMQDEQQTISENASDCALKGNESQAPSDKYRPTSLAVRNPLTGQGCEPNAKIKIESVHKHKDGNPLTGTGYEESKKTSRKVPPGGYSHGIW